MINAMENEAFTARVHTMESERLVIPYAKKVEMMAIPVDHLIEERVGRGRKTLDYIPWVEAQLLLNEHFPTFEVCYVEPTPHMPFVATNHGVYILAYIRCLETGRISQPIFYPVMDNNHGPVTEPDMNQLNTALWRASVKCIALVTGLGLSVFRRLKEDVPPELPKEPKPVVAFEEEDTPPEPRKKLGLGLGKKLS